MTADIERRAFVDPVELRRSAATGTLTAAGYAYRFASTSGLLKGPRGEFYEQVKPGAAKASLTERKVLALYNHDTNHLLGRQESGTLRIREDSTGLFYEVDLPDTTAGRDVAELLQRRDLTGSSFGFIALKDNYTGYRGKQLRTVQLMDLIEVSLVARPAYADANVGLAGTSAAAVIANTEPVPAGARSEIPARERERIGYLYDHAQLHPRSEP